MFCVKQEKLSTTAHGSGWASQKVLAILRRWATVLPTILTPLEADSPRLTRACFIKQLSPRSSMFILLQLENEYNVLDLFF